MNEKTEFCDIGIWPFSWEVEAHQQQEKLNKKKPVTITDLIELSKIVTSFLGAPENKEAQEYSIRLTKELERLRK